MTVRPKSMDKERYSKIFKTFPKAAIGLQTVYIIIPLRISDRIYSFFF